MPGWFSGSYLYKEPERLSAEQARERRLNAALERSRKELEDRTAPLSPANKVHLQRLQEFQRKFGERLEARRREVERLRKLEPSMSNSRLLRAAIAGHFQLKAMQAELLQRAGMAQRAKRLEASAAASRFSFHDFGFHPSTIFGTSAFLGKRGGRFFRNPTIVIPCIQRAVRKEVMFAKGHGGKAHRGTHRFNPASLIGC